VDVDVDVTLGAGAVLVLCWRHGEEMNLILSKVPSPLSFFLCRSRFCHHNVALRLCRIIALSLQNAHIHLKGRLENEIGECKRVSQGILVFR
jgi:hypothetical protein